MTKDEFIIIVKKFNEEKIKYNWIELKTCNIRMKWEKFKSKIQNYPTYYNFNSFREFKYWLINSDNKNFIEERFCPICGNFIESNRYFYGWYNGGCCKEHCKIVRMNNVKESLLQKYGTTNIFGNKEIRKKIEESNLAKYGVKYPLQSKEIHTKTIQTGKANDSYKKAVSKIKATKLERYGDENYNNSKSISKTKLSWSEERKNKYLERVRKTRLDRYGDENYNNREKNLKTCLERYGVDNPAKSEKIKEIIRKNAVQTRIKNHTTQKELLQNQDYLKNYVAKTRETKRKNGTTNTSHEFEDKLINYLREKYPEYEIIQSYSIDPRYPYECDCYIKELDLFIEFQGLYYHNYKPFVESEETIKEYNTLIAKGKQKAVIANVWRYRDVEKRECAKKNNLNYLEYWEKQKDEPYDPIERWKLYSKKKDQI